MECDVVDFEPYLDVFLIDTSSFIGTIKKVKFDEHNLLQQLRDFLEKGHI